MVNPRACHETKMPKLPPAPNPQNIAVIGAGAAGLSFAIEAKKLGHNITLFDASADIGGQMAYARKVPGKEEFDEFSKPIEFVLDILTKGEHILISKKQNKYNVFYQFRKKFICLSYVEHENIILIHIAIKK